MNTLNWRGVVGIALVTALLGGCASSDDDYADDGGYVEDTESGLYVEQDTAFTGSDAGSASGNSSASSDSLISVLYFDFDSAQLTDESRVALDAQIARLQDTVGTIRLEGHADERGTREYNVALGERRALAVADYMALNGVPRYRIETVSYGEERPVAFGQDDESWSLNRRVELK